MGEPPLYGTTQLKVTAFTAATVLTTGLGYEGTSAAIICMMLLIGLVWISL
jgi:hypothetical protein